MITTYGEGLSRTGLSISEYRNVVAIDCIDDHRLDISLEYLLSGDIGIKNAVKVKEFMRHSVSNSFLINDLPLRTTSNFLLLGFKFGKWFDSD